MRALLIQKDVKPAFSDTIYPTGLRALLIQKDVKHIYNAERVRLV